MRANNLRLSIATGALGASKRIELRASITSLRPFPFLHVAGTKNSETNQKENSTFSNDLAALKTSYTFFIFKSLFSIDGNF
jgi:hypothetical protein